MTIDYPWWKDSIVYQIWPASFKDGNGDGFGDLHGVLDKLDYLKDLGVSVIWLSPHYDSPQDDMGYDISDYNKIYPPYGDLELMDKIIKKVHENDMKIIFDLVINHTSSEHAWFKESRSSKTNPKRDWYIWKPPKYDAEGNRHPPNNWRSHFSGSAWEYDETTDEYYLRLFAKTQPDLNWENEETRHAIYNTALKFWYERGVDGFRIDTAGLYSKKQEFKDAPIVIPGPWQPCDPETHNGPRIHEFHKEMFNEVSSKYDVFTVGEVGHSSREETLKYVSAKEKEMNMLFLFDTVEVGSNPADRFRYNGWNLKDFKDAIINQSDFVKGTDAWSTVFIENHDQPRSVTRFGNTSNKQLWSKSAKLLSILQTTLTGTLFIYQGQEIGMTNVPLSWDISEYLDINTVNYWAEFLKGNPTKEEKETMLKNINLVARDNSRTPVQWDSSEYGGFGGKPWMRVNDNYKEINVASQIDDADSVLSFWKKALQVRKDYRGLLNHGDFEVLDYENLKTFTYSKTFGDEKAVVVLNFTDGNVKFEEPAGEVILTNYEAAGSELKPYEGRVYLEK